MMEKNDVAAEGGLGKKDGVRLDESGGEALFRGLRCVEAREKVIHGLVAVGVGGIVFEVILPVVGRDGSHGFAR